MDKDIDEDLIEATIRRVQAQSASGVGDQREAPDEPPPADPPLVGDDIEATIRRVQAQAAARAQDPGQSDAPGAADEDPIEATVRRVQAQSALRAGISSEFAPAPLPPLELDDRDGDAVDQAIHYAEAHAAEPEPIAAKATTGAPLREPPPIEETPWPGRDERMLGEPATWEIAAQRLEQGLQDTQHEVRALAGRLDSVLSAIERLTRQPGSARPPMTVVHPSPGAAADAWDDRPKISPMPFGAPPRPPVFRDPSPQAATAAELVEEPEREAGTASPAAAHRLHVIGQDDLESRLPRQYRVTVEDKRRGVDLVPLHRALQSLERVKDMSLLSYSNGVAIVSMETVGAIDPEDLRAAVERAMSRPATIEIHNEQTMVVKVQEA
jgi:hypothetical protein